jgi:hypothetical protein
MHALQHRFSVLLPAKLRKRLTVLRGLHPQILEPSPFETRLPQLKWGVLPINT